jgi:hypothetical protein
MIIFMLVLGFVFWYLYYGMECYINGGSLGRNQFSMHFSLLWEEFLWFLPGGFDRRVDYLLECKVINPDVADYSEQEIREITKEMLPGRLHFVLTHGVLPLIPLLIYGVIKYVESKCY